MAVSDVTLAELTTLKAIETVEGQCALALAEQIDADRKNSMATSGDVARLLSVMDVIRERSTEKAADSVDDSRDATLTILKSVG